MAANELDKKSPNWMRWILVLAGVYNLGWGTFCVLFPTALFQFAAMELPRYPQIWQCVGMIVGVYGIGYLIAAMDPVRHWPITLVGLLGKIFGPIGFAVSLAQGELPPAFGATIVTNDLIWWVPFTAILYRAAWESSDRTSGVDLDLAQAIAAATSHRGASLDELSWQAPTLVVFLRHTGCAFCREAVADVSKLSAELEASGLNLAFVHMSEPLPATEFFLHFETVNAHRFSDSTCTLYRAFGLDRAGLWRLFNPSAVGRGIRAALIDGHGIGRICGDLFRMPGVFLLERGSVTAAFRPWSPADRPDYHKILAAARTQRQPAIPSGAPPAGWTP